MVDQEISTKSEAEGGTKRTMSVRLAVFLVLGMMLLLIAGVLAYRSAMNFQGYCLAEGVILSENEKIRRAIEDRLKVYPPAALEEHHSQDGLNWSISFKPKHPVYYKDVDEFLSVNPNCCTISERSSTSMDYFTPRFTDLITGSVCGFVRLEYKVRYLDHQGVMQSAVYVEDFSISNCGKLGPWFIFGED